MPFVASPTYTDSTAPTTNYRELGRAHQEITHLRADADRLREVLKRRTESRKSSSPRNSSATEFCDTDRPKGRDDGYEQQPSTVTNMQTKFTANILRRMSSNSRSVQALSKLSDGERKRAKMEQDEREKEVIRHNTEYQKGQSMRKASFSTIGEFYMGLDR